MRGLDGDGSVAIAFVNTVNPRRGGQVTRSCSCALPRAVAHDIAVRGWLLALGWAAAVHAAHLMLV